MSRHILTRAGSFEIASDMTGVDGSWSVRPCDECRRLTPFDNPDAEIRICFDCMRALASEP